jgi:cytochrome c oxidase subunit 3
MDGSDTDESAGHEHLPAINDWPQGLGEASGWPIVLVVSLVGLYVGAGLYFFGRRNGGTIELFGAALVIGSIVLFAVSAGGWLYQAFVIDFWERHAPTGGQALRFGMLLFLATDISTFGAGFVYYFFIRLGKTWPLEHIPEGLLSLILAVNTAALVISSLTYYWGERNLGDDNRKRFVAGVGLTFLLGCLFVAGQILEYYQFITQEGFTVTSGLYASAFYALTALHGLHVVFGVLIIGTVLVRGYNGQFSSDRHTSVRTVGWYWHFVDAVWLFLVAVIYFGSQLTLPLPGPN